MVNQIGDQVVLIRKNGRIAFLNKAAARGYGYPVSKIKNQLITKFIKENLNVAQWQKKYFSKVKKSKNPLSFTVQRKIKGGKIRTIDVTGVYMKYNLEEYMLCVARDITERLELQTKLRESENLYKLLSEQAGDGIFIVDLKGAIIYANKAGENLLKTTSKKIIGSHFQDFVDKSSREKAWESFRKVINGATTIQDELYVIDSGHNQIPIEFTASPIYTNNKMVHVQAIVRDVTRRRQFEEIAREADKMRALQNFISGAAHELEHPLNGILKHSQNLIKKYKFREYEYIGYKEFQDIMHTLEVMRDQVKYCFETTRRLLDLNKKKAGLKSKCCEVNKVVKETIQALEHHLAVSDIDLRLNLGSKLPPIAIDPVEFTQIVENVLTNAIQSIVGGGTIQIKTKHIKQNDIIQIDFRDNGIGIEKENLSRIFEPFYSTKQRGLERNSGLGLAIVYSIIKSVHGDITVQSSLRRGTVVKITLPEYKDQRKINGSKKRKP